MPKSTDELLQKLDSAFKAITDVTQLGESVLAHEKFDQFVEEMQHRTVILPAARFVEMDAPRTDIDRIGFMDRVLTYGLDKDGTPEGDTSESFVEPSTGTNKLEAVELRGKAALTDRALRRNIERGAFEDTLVSLFGQAAGRDFEEWALLADDDISTDILALGDGWLKKADNKVYGEGNGDFDADDSEDLFDAMLAALPKRFRQNLNELRFYVPWKYLDDYRDKLRGRGTALGDEAQTGAQRLMYKGVPLAYAPALELSKSAHPADEDPVLLTHPDNTAWGVFHEVTIERKREAADRQTEFYLTIECDADFENEEAVVAAFPNRAE